MHYEGRAQGVFPRSCIRVEIAMDPTVVESVVCDPATCLAIWLYMHTVDWVHERLLGAECFNIWAALRVYLHQRASMMSPAFPSVSGGSNVRPL